jgi:Ca2+/Na+ antiporter
MHPLLTSGIGGLFFLIVGSFITFICVSYMNVLQIAYPHWLKNLFLVTPILFVLAFLALRRLGFILSIAIASLIAFVIIFYPYYFFRNATTSVQLHKVMTQDEKNELDNLTQGRFIVWFPESPSSSALLPADNDGLAARRFMKDHGLIK